MRVELTGFSQDVSLSSKDERLNFFVFRSDAGREFRIPVTEEAMQQLLAEVYGEDQISAPLMEEPESLEPDATVFGDEEDVPSPADDSTSAPADEPDIDEPHTRRVRMPTREEDVPSL